MPFSKGDKNINRKGRKKGTVNHSTKAIREVIRQHLSDNLSTYLDELSKMKMGHAKAQTILGLLSYVLSKPTDPVRLDINSMKESELHELLKEAYAKGSD